MDKWQRLLYLSKDLLSSDNTLLKSRLKEKNTVFAKDILLCVERLVSENLHVDGWLLYDNPIDEQVYCFKREFLPNQWMYIDFEIFENDDFRNKKYAVPCVTVRTNPIFFNSLKELFFYNMHLKHDAGNTQIQ